MTAAPAAAQTAARATSRNGLLFIANREALVLTAYQDGPHCSVGFGHNDAALRVGETITVRRAFDLLKADVAHREHDLNALLRVPVTQPQYDALIDLHYQSGNRYLPEVVRLVNVGRPAAAAELLPSCDHDLHGDAIGGLRVRRLLEQAVFLHGDYGPLDPIPYWPGDPRHTRRQVYHLQPRDL